MPTNRAIMEKVYVMLGGEVRYGNVPCILPYHGGNDLHPSAHIYEEGRYVCFKCGETYDCVGLVASVLRFSREQAGLFLQARNIVLAPSVGTPVFDRGEVLLQRLFDAIHEQAIPICQGYYQKVLSVPDLERILTQRGVKDAGYIPIAGHSIGSNSQHGQTTSISRT